jgi:hypothetical protein
MLLDRKHLPALIKLSYQFDMDKISEAFESFKNFDIYQDLNYNNPDAS